MDDNLIVHSALTWAKSKAEEINVKFQDEKSVDITYKDIGRYPLNVDIEIAPGVKIRVIHYDSAYFVVRAWMNGTLSSHFHSTHDELFFCISGDMTDNINPNVKLKPGSSHMYNKGVNHEPTGINELIIIGFLK